MSQKLGADFYFATPDHSWERGLNEHTNIANGQKATKNRLTVLENGQKNLELGQSEIKGDIRTLDGKIENLSCKQIELKLWRTRRGKPPISPKKSEN